MPPSCDTTHTLPIPQAHFIWYCAWLSFPSAIYAYAHPATAHLAPIPTAVFATSLLYWRNPIRDSWRRKLDMAVVISGASYQTYYVYNTDAISYSTKQTYATLMGISAMCYASSQYFLKDRRYWPATYTHASIHLFANIANIVLYYGINDHFHTGL
jgi:hypothetical protein